MILLLDNYDSFVHTLAGYLRELGHDCTVERNDSLSVEDVLRAKPSALVFSPGPCTPETAGITLELAAAAAGLIPMLGVCLGHQAIVAAFGGNVRRARVPMHGKSAPVRHDASALFRGLPSPLEVGRYHSLIGEIDPDGPLRATAWSPEGELMAVEHTSLPVWGVQFHPESILTQAGHRLLSNFLEEARKSPPVAA